jgi:hypothetical protein
MCFVYREYMSCTCLCGYYNGAEPTRQIGSVVIVLHAPSDKDVETVDEILGYAAQPGELDDQPYLLVPAHELCPAFLFYLAFVGIFATYMIYRVVPTQGTKNPMVYLSICSLVGSISVMAIKVGPDS